MFLFQVVKQAGPESKSQITRAAMFKAYNEISDKIGAMMNAIASSNSSAILPYSGSPLDIGFEILNSKAYKEVLSKCPEFEAIFQSAMYGLRLCQIGDTPEKTALMKAVSDELWLHHEEQMGAKLAHPPQTSEDLRPLNDIFRANAFYSLSDLHNNMLDGFLSIQLSDALKTNNMSAINNVLDLMALFQDMRYGVVRTEPVPKSPFPLVAGDGVKNQTAGLNNLPPEILAERGKLHLEKTPEDRFLETSKVYAVNKAIVNGNTAYASQLLAANLGKTASGKSKNLEIDYGTSTNTYANKADFGLEVAYSTSPVVYANRCGLADMYILQPKSFLPLVPFYLGIKDLATAFYRWGTTGKFDKELAAIGAAYLTLDVFAIMTGGFSKGATLLLKSERTVAKFAELSAEAIKIENRLKKIETLIITAKSTTVLTKELNLLKTDLEILANLNKDILGVVKPLRFQGGVREVFTAKNITTKVKRTENIIKETQNLTAAPAPGTAPLTPAEMALQVNKLSLKYAKFGSSSAQYAEKLTAIMGLKSTLNYGIGRFTSENAGKVENALKPLLHSSQKSYAKYLDELGNAAKTEINALKDGEHLTISFKQTGDGFTFVKEGDKTLVYRTSEFAPTTTLVKDIAVGDAKTLWGKLLPPVPLNKEVADRLIAGLEVNDFAKLDELSEGEQLTVTVKKMKYTIIKGPEVGGVATFSVFKESVLASYWNTIKSTYETASKSLGTASNRARQCYIEHPNRNSQRAHV
ncbi:MAG: hypothetical protein NT051_07070 [Candidatus Micrarchaeota archaeon]|nr:hypothetical protein [Candidatus Micrarchaeota archaeon]